MSQATNFVLIQFSVNDAPPSYILEIIANICNRSHSGLSLHRFAWSKQNQVGYAYARLPSRTVMSTNDLTSIREEFEGFLGDTTVAEVSRLECVFEQPGISYKEKAAFHYVVEMDPDTGWMPEIARWYDTEHMPGLAAVPGCVYAMRMLNHDTGPFSLACYDLTSDQTLGSPPWMAVRNTPWSDVARPHFTNTKRTMFTVVA